MPSYQGMSGQAQNPYNSMGQQFYGQFSQNMGQYPMQSYQGMAGQAQGALAQQMFSDPSMLNPQDRAFFNQQFQGMFNQNTGQSPMQQTNFGQIGQMAGQAQGTYGQLQGQYNQNMGQMMNRQQWQGANAGVGSAPTVDDIAARQALFDQRVNDLRQRQWNNVLEPRGGRVNFPGGG
jgi:hypothetical protein